MPPTATAAAVTDGYRDRMTLVRETTADALAGLLADVDLDVRPLALEAGLQRWNARAASLLVASSDQAATLSSVYVPAYVRAGGGEPVVVIEPLPAKPPDLDTVRSALLWRLGRRDGRGAAMHTATATARRLARTTVATSAVQTLAEGYDREPAVERWHRVTGPTCCQRCAVLATRTYPTSTRMFLRHPGDRCTPEAVLVGIRERFTRRAPTVVAA